MKNWPLLECCTRVWDRAERRGDARVPPGMWRIKGVIVPSSLPEGQRE